MNKLPTNENIIVTRGDNQEIIVRVVHNYEEWECRVDLSEYKCYGCENNQDLESLLVKSIKSPDSDEVFFTFYEKELKIDFIIDLGFKKITKNVVIPKIKNMTDVEKLELFVLDKFEDKDTEISGLKTQIQEKDKEIKEQGEIISRLSRFQFLDYTVIGDSVVSISQTKKLKLVSYNNNNSSYFTPSTDFSTGNTNFQLILIGHNMHNISNIRYLKNLEKLCLNYVSIPDSEELQLPDLSFLEELPHLTHLNLFNGSSKPASYLGKTTIKLEKKIQVRPASWITIV